MRCMRLQFSAESIYNNFDFLIGMQTKAMPSFLQISINTDKFAHFTSALNSILAAHDRTLQDHTRQLQQLRTSVDDRLFRLRKQIEYEGEQVQKQRKADSKYFCGFINDWTSKHVSFAEEWRERIGKVEERNVEIKKQVDRGNGGWSGVQEVRARMGEMIGECRLSMEREVQTVAVRIQKMEEQLKSAVTANDSLLKNLLQGYQNRSRSAENVPLSVLHGKGQRDPHKQPDLHFSIEQMTIKEGREKRRRKVQQKCEQQNLQYASISAKIDEIENRIIAKQNESINKVVWPNRRPDSIISELSQNNLSVSMNQIELQRKNLEQTITLKLQHIEDIIQQKFGKMERDMAKMANAHGILADAVEIAGNRAEKERLKVGDLGLQLRKMEQRRLDEKTVEGLLREIRRQNAVFEQSIERKMTRDVFDKEKQRLNEKMLRVSERLGEKADKEEIKRAFEFVEDKIKEIVLLMAEDIQQEKEGAVRRVLFKCLSCDKDLECPTARVERREGERKALSRSGTSQIRKRIRVTMNDER